MTVLIIIEDITLELTFKVTGDELTPLSEAITVVLLPVLRPVALPVLSIVATVASAVDQVTWLVISAFDPSA